MVKHLFALLLVASFILTCECAPKHPVVLVPGLGGSKLWSMKESEHCYRGLWIDPFKAIVQLDSLLEALTLNVNPTTGAIINESGYTIKACGFGDPEVLTNIITPWDPPTACVGNKGFCKVSSYIEKHFDELIVAVMENSEDALELIEIFCKHVIDCSKTTEDKLEFLLLYWRELRYYKYIIESLVENGYTANKDIKGAPYDFRKAPDGQRGFYVDLKQLVEKLYHDNNNVPVVMVAHSMGNPILLYFYNKVVTKDWKDTYIHAHIALAPAWAGAVKPVKLMVSGENEHIPIIPNTMVRPMQRSWPGAAWLMPSPSHGLWPSNEPLVVTPNKTYSVKDYKELFEDMKYRAGYRMWERTQQYSTDVSKVPELRALHVLYGDNVDTPNQYVYPAGTFPDSDPQVRNGTGDGTVNKRSLEAFKKFEPNKFVNLTHHAFDGVDHMEIMRDPRVLKFITDLVLNYEEPSAYDLSQDREKTEL